MPSDFGKNCGLFCEIVQRNHLHNCTQRKFSSLLERMVPGIAQVVPLRIAQKNKHTQCSFAQLDTRTFVQLRKWWVRMRNLLKLCEYFNTLHCLKKTHFLGRIWALAVETVKPQLNTLENVNDKRQFKVFP